MSIETCSYQGLLYERYPNEELMSWTEALLYAKSLNEHGFEKWRLATVEELQKLFRQPKKKFLKNLNAVWSGSKEDKEKSWVMDFHQNFYYIRNNELKFRVLCVKDTALKRSIKFF